MYVHVTLVSLQRPAGIALPLHYAPFRLYLLLPIVNISYLHACTRTGTTAFSSLDIARTLKTKET